MASGEKQPRRRYRWLRFSLRSLLVGFTIGCLLLGYWVYRAERQRAAVKWVRDNGGIATYDFDVDEDGQLIENAKPPYPEWLRAFLADDYLGAVFYVDLSGSDVKDVRPLAGLTSLEYLDLRDTNVTDVTPLTGLTNLWFLSLEGTQITDVTPLTRMTSLELLTVRETPIRQEQLRSLRSALPHCHIVY